MDSEKNRVKMASENSCTSSVDLTSRKQLSLDQMQGLLEFLKDHQELAKGLTRGRRGKLHTLKLWNQCAKKLNAYKNGAIKDGKGWSKYWCDWKYRVRRRALELKAANEANGSPSEGVTPLTNLEENLLNIIGMSTLEGVVIKSDPLADGDTEEEGSIQAETNENDDTESLNQYCQYYGEKRRNSRDHSDPDEPPNKPRERKRKKHSNRSEGQPDHDEHATEFLRLEREKLDNSTRVQESLQSIATQLTRMTDVIIHIRDVLINNRINV